MKQASALLLLSFLAFGCARAEQALHPGFLLTASSFKERTARMPVGTARLASGDPARFLTLLKEVLAAPSDLLVLVDKARGLDAGAQPADLVSLTDYPSLRLNRSDLKMRRAAAEALVAMCDSARKAKIPLVIASAYRAYSYQETLFDWNVKTYGREVTEREIARPGHSQHQLGTAVDFDPTDERFHGTPAALWLEAHAEDFGFSLSYPKGREAETGYVFESWHYRYVGMAAAGMIRGFFDGSQQAFLSWFSGEGDAYREALQPADPRTRPGTGKR